MVLIESVPGYCSLFTFTDDPFYRASLPLQHNSWFNACGCCSDKTLCLSLGVSFYFVTPWFFRFTLLHHIFYTSVKTTRCLCQCLAYFRVCLSMTGIIRFVSVCFYHIKLEDSDVMSLWGLIMTMLPASSHISFNQKLSPFTACQ